MLTSTLLRQKLKNMPVWALPVYAALCSFAVYFCMYAFRKPFAAAGFSGIQFLNIDYKVWLVTAQVIGYMLSKFYGIKFISGMQGERRATTIVKLILLAWLSLLLFAITPAPYNIVFLLLNNPQSRHCRADYHVETRRRDHQPCAFVRRFELHKANGNDFY